MGRMVYVPVFDGGEYQYSFPIEARQQLDFAAPGGIVQPMEPAQVPGQEPAPQPPPPAEEPPVSDQLGGLLKQLPVSSTGLGFMVGGALFGVGAIAAGWLLGGL